MAKNIHVSKIVPTSTPTAWSQAYHAGTLSAVIAVTPKDQEDATSLHIVGKDLINTFESEYFTLENKNLTSIRDAVETTYKKSADTHLISFLVAAAIQNTLYLILAGKGSIFLLRKGKLGVLLDQEKDETTVLSSSGFLEDGDVVILTTPAFLDLVPKEKLFTTLTENSLAESAEMLTPLVHATEKGDAASLFFLFEDEATPRPHEMGIEEKHHEEVIKPQESLHENREKEQIQEEKIQQEEPIFSEPLVPEEAKPQKTPRSAHRRKLLLTIVIVIVIVLGLTSYFAISKQKEAQNAALFASVYPQAQQKYQDGLGLMDLNEPLAHQDFQNAKDLLEGAQSKLPSNSVQYKQLADLLQKVDTSLAESANTNAVSATKVDNTTNARLTYALSHPDILYLDEDATNIYTADATAITQINKKTQTEKKLIPSTWSSLGGFATYLNNFYLLDQKAGILKFVPSGSSFVKSNYFAQGVNPDLSTARSIAIDGSIWILESNGTILKFTKGKQDTFTLSGLSTPLSSPTQIVTSVDMDNIYILDTGNGRIVVADKTGAYKNEYATGIMKKATQLVVDEKNKIALFVASGSMYQITLK